MLAHGIFALSLVVRIHDAYGIPSDSLARAQATTAAIMKTAGIAMTWPRCPCLSPVGPGELVVRIARTTPASPPASLGFSFVDTGIKAGTLATVFADRVLALAWIAGVDDGELLGRVIAHEISHLLVGTRDHAAQGLMRAEWKASELARQRPSDWLLSRAESRQIRQAITRRTSESPPALMIVEADSAPRDKSRFEANP